MDALSSFSKWQHFSKTIISQPERALARYKSYPYFSRFTRTRGLVCMCAFRPIQFHHMCRPFVFTISQDTELSAPLRSSPLVSLL